MRDSLRSESLCLSETKDGKPVFLTRFNLLTKVEPIFFPIKKSHTSHSKRDFWFICENEG